MKKGKNNLKLIFLLLGIALGMHYMWYQYGHIAKKIRPLEVEQIPPSTEIAFDHDFSIQEITSSNIAAAKEYPAFSFSRTDADVIQISESPDRNSILAIYSDGAFRKFDMREKKVVEEYRFHSANAETSYFNQDCSLAVTSGTIWDTQTGEALNCYDMAEGKCRPIGINSVPNPDELVVDPIRRIEVYAHSYGVNWFSIDRTVATPQGVYNGGLACWDFIASYDPIEQRVKYDGPAVRYIGIDPSGKYVACVIQNGVVIVRDWSLSFDDTHVGKYGENVTREYPYVHILRYKLPDKDVLVKDVVFDATRTWLSVLTDENLVVWDLRQLLFARKINIPVANGNAIAFDRTGTLLVLGTSQGFVVYEIDSGKEITKFDVGEVTALYFTCDNRLLVWGDAEGNVHLWGVPNP